MYDDPKHIRSHRVNLSLNEDEDELASAAARYNKMQKSVFLRQLVLQGLNLFSSHTPDSEEEQGEKRHGQS
jgi:hypothetical protein